MLTSGVCNAIWPGVLLFMLGALLLALGAMHSVRKLRKRKQEAVHSLRDSDLHSPEAQATIHKIFYMFHAEGTGDMTLSEFFDLARALYPECSRRNLLRMIRGVPKHISQDQLTEAIEMLQNAHEHSPTSPRKMGLHFPHHHDHERAHGSRNSSGSSLLSSSSRVPTHDAIDGRNLQSPRESSKKKASRGRAKVLKRIYGHSTSNTSVTSQDSPHKDHELVEQGKLLCRPVDATSAMT